MNNFFYRVLIVILIVCILLCSIIPAFATGLDPVLFLYPIWESFGLANGLSITTVGGDAFVRDSFPSLFNEWQLSRVSSGLQETVETLSDFVDVVRAGLRIGSSATGGSILRFGATVADSLYSFWNWLIVDKLDASSYDAVDFNTDTGNIAFRAEYREILFNGYPGYGVPFTFPYGEKTRTVTSTDPNGFVLTVSNGTNYYLYFLSKYSNASFTYNQSTNNLDSQTYVTIDSVKYYWSRRSGYGDFPGPVSSDHGSNITESFGPFDSASTFSDVTYPEASVSVAPDVGVDVLGFPDIYGEDYIPADTNIEINVPYDPALTVDQVMDEASEYAIENELEATLDVAEPLPPATPSEVIIPFLPVNLPSFNFSLSGIWHYVRDWVTSLGSWLQMMLYIWSGLPYAMVVPVYAALVITVVVGVYRRFFM